MKSENKNSDKFIVYIDQDKIEPEIARETVIKYDPLNRPGKEGGFYIDENEELHIDDDDVMEAHRMAIKKYPYDGAIQLVNLKKEMGEKVHQFGENTFRLYGLPKPEEGDIVGILGRNGIGKSVALKILSGKIKPNLGNWEKPPTWKKNKEKYRGTALQNHFTDLAEQEIETSFKPQKVEDLPKVYEGQVKDLLKQSEERVEIEDIAEDLEIAKLLERELKELSGGELQRVAIASTLMKEADIYMFDEPSSFLDVKQRLKIAQKIRELKQDDKKVLVVEHDLATLDLVADHIHVFHGEPATYGMASNKLTTREGINQYLDGYLESHNLQIRDESLEFVRTKRSQVQKNPPIMKYPELAKNFGPGEFSLKTKQGTLHEEEVMAIFGENGLGKTVFAKLLSGQLKPDNTDKQDYSISYKPQYIDASKGTVYEALSEHANPESKRFETRIAEPLELEDLYENNLQELSGGELQRVAIALCLSRNAEAYLLDEPSAYLDVEARVKLGKTLKRFARKTEKPLIIIDHDLMLLDYVADTGTVFHGKPGIQGQTTQKTKLSEAMNTFLKQLQITYRKDPDTGRPRANKKGSQKDKTQKKKENYYEN